MTQFLANFYAVLATVPFISFIIIYLIANIKTRNKKESLHWAIHITMILLLSSVSFMMRFVTGSIAGFWWMILALILFGGLLTWLQWKIRQRIQLLKVFRAVWYLGFAVFSLTYFILFISGIVVHYQQA